MPDQNATSRTTVQTNDRKPSPVQPVPIVYIVSDGGADRAALVEAFGTSGWRTEVVPTMADFLASPKPTVPSCLVLDGILLEQRLALRLDISVICLAAGSDVASVVRAMKAGATNVLPLPVCREALLQAIGQALDSSATSQRQLLEEQRLHQRYASLNPRERQVMHLVGSGLSNRDVGGTLGISERTVKAHRGRLMRKMNVRSHAELIQIVLRLQSATVS